MYVWYNGDADVRALWHDNGRGYGRPKLLIKQELKTDHVVGNWQQGKRREGDEKTVGNLSKNLKRQ